MPILQQLTPEEPGMTDRCAVPDCPNEAAGYAWFATPKFGEEWPDGFVAIPETAPVPLCAEHGGLE